MKSITLIISFVLFTSIANSQEIQFKMQDFIKMAYFNIDEFETYILKKGFYFSHTQKYTSFDVMHYQKEGNFITKSIANPQTKIIRDVFYETSSTDEYTFLKSQAQSLGFKYITSEKFKVDNNTIYHIYRKENIEIKFYTSNRDTYLGYCMGIDIK